MSIIGVWRCMFDGELVAAIRPYTEEGPQIRYNRDFRPQRGEILPHFCGVRVAARQGVISLEPRPPKSSAQAR